MFALFQSVAFYGSSKLEQLNVVWKFMIVLGTGNAEIVGQLARHGANPSLPATGGVTALHAAAELGDLVTAQALLNVSCQCNAAKTIHLYCAAPLRLSVGMSLVVAS